MASKFWKTLAGAAESIFDPDFQQKAKAAAFDPTAPMNVASPAPAATPSFNDVNAMANATPSTPGLRKLFSLNGSPSPSPTDVPPDGQYDERDPAYQADTPPSRFAQAAALQPPPDPSTGSGREMPADTPPVAQPAPTARPMSQTDTDVQALRDAQSTEKDDVVHATDRAKKRNMFSRFVRAAGNNLRNGGDWYTAAVEGVAEAASPAERAKRLQQQKMQKMFGKVAQDSQIDAIQQKGQQDIYKTQGELAKAQGEQIKNALELPEFQRKTLEGNRKFVFDSIYGQQDEFDPTDPANAEHVAELKAAGIPVVHKKKGEKFQHVVLPNGDLKLFNPTTGEFKDAGNYAKPEKVTANELPDTLFGLPDEKEIADRAAASIGAVKADRTMRPEAQAALLKATRKDAKDNVTYPYRNDDGSVNEQAYWDDMVSGDAMLKPGDVYQNNPSNAAQQVATARNQLRATYKARRAEVDEFRTAISNHTPGPDAKAVPITTITRDFNQILNIKDAAKRKAAIKAYYSDILPHIKVGG